MKEKSTEVIVSELDDFWRRKIKMVTLVSKKYGFPEYNEEFWVSHTAGVISLILKIYKDKKVQ